MFSLDPQIVSAALGSARLATWEWDASRDELRWTSGQSEIYSRPALEINSTAAWEALVHPEDRVRLQSAVEMAMATETGFREQFRVAGKNGGFLWIFGYGKVLRGTDGSLKLLGLNIDVTDWVEKLSQSEAKFSATFEQAAVGIAHVGTDGKWLNVNRRCCEIVGYSKEELLNLTFADITHPEDLDADWSQVQALLRGDRWTYSMEKRYRTKDKNIIWVNLTVALVRKEDGTPDYFISVIEDISTRKRVEGERDELIEALEERVRQRTAQLEQLSLTDSLTGVANRRRLDQYLVAEWNRAARSQQPISILMIDIDYFKELNDALGHSSADGVLIEVASALQQIARRPADLVARYGGDEFVMVLPDTDSDGAISVADRIQNAVRLANLTNPGSPLAGKITVSQGIATAMPVAKGSHENLMAAADSALFHAKRTGKNCYSRTPKSRGIMDGARQR